MKNIDKQFLTRRDWLTTTTAIGATTFVKQAVGAPGTGASTPENVVDIGSRRELFVDHFLIDRLNGTHLKLHEPQLAPPMTEPADKLEYATVIKDGDLFRLYTRDARGATKSGDVTEVTRYCESKDGIHWTKPVLGLHEVDGSRQNNVILREVGACHNFSPFLDTRPGLWIPGRPEVPNDHLAVDRRFKALGGIGVGPNGGLFAFSSDDGIHWTKLSDKSVITSSDDIAFDSQNVSFWSQTEQCYVCYFRTWKTTHGKLRSVSRTTSKDFLSWSEPVVLEPNFPGEHLYTNQTHPYFRAPHIYVALPTRFHPRRGDSTDIVFMTARGDRPYDRTFREAFIRPGLDIDRWGNRANYAALNVVPTGSSEMSIYTTPFRRFTLRTDGFASVHAGPDRSEMVTHPIRFDGRSLVVNYSTSGGGHLKVELQTIHGKPLPGFDLAACQILVGDAVEQSVTWTGGDLSRLAGMPVRLRFMMQEADLYSLKFNS
ncbi:MAG: hypothetical protein MK110_12325 [Fuerstiella sp.]|nr:hypothetical protein [Fuerstiella sp.]